VSLTGDLADCVCEILCALGNALLAPVKALLTAQVAVLTVTVSQARVALAGLQIVTAPLELVKATADGAVEIVRNQLLCLPSFENCVDLGSLAEILSGIADDATAPIQAVIDDINVKLAEVRRLEAYIERIETEIASIQAVIDALSICAELDLP